MSTPSPSLSFLLLSLSFLSCYTPQNALSPNLTPVGMEFGIEGEKNRDLYLGTVINLAQHVFSLPIAAGLGVAADR